MLRFILASSIVAVAALGAAVPTLASQCPALIHAIYEAAGNRFDSAAYDARQKAALAARLHAEGKHREAELMARQGLELLIKK
jgi:hypothetical protein